MQGMEIFCLHFCCLHHLTRFTLIVILCHEQLLSTYITALGRLISCIGGRIRAKHLCRFSDFNVACLL